VVRSGAFTARFVHPVTPEQIQPNGVDLRLGELFRVVEAGRVGEITQLGRREPVVPDPGRPLPPGAYVVRYREAVEVPPGHVGRIYPRSSLLRSGAMLFTALWDQGYRGRGEALLVLWSPLHLAPGARIGQFVLETAEEAAPYAGQWQGEGL
jgi:deoxycytidine triphosphate deaminase